ncbi:Uncharacterised protein [uncultured archaeon]|nr:Uncharacterised protein [uncultured archaeon]
MERSSARLWRKIRARYNLVGNECQSCKSEYFPPRPICKKCGKKTEMAVKKFAGNGEVYSFTKIRVPPDTFREEAPYYVGVIKLEEGPMVEGHILDDGREIKIGTKVRAAFRRMYVEGDEGLIHYQFKFEPI